MHCPMSCFRENNNITSRVPPDYACTNTLVALFYFSKVKLHSTIMLWFSKMESKCIVAFYQRPTFPEETSGRLRKKINFITKQEVQHGIQYDIQCMKCEYLVHRKYLLSFIVQLSTRFLWIIIRIIRCYRKSIASTFFYSIYSVHTRLFCIFRVFSSCVHNGFPFI